jgi:hypothetical protein
MRLKAHGRLEERRAELKMGRTRRVDLLFIVDFICTVMGSNVIQ